MCALNYYTKVTLKKKKHIQALMVPKHQRHPDLCGICSPLRSLHFDNIDLLILWREVGVHHRLRGHTAVLQSPP